MKNNVSFEGLSLPWLHIWRHNQSWSTTEQMSTGVSIIFSRTQNKLKVTCRFSLNDMRGNVRCPAFIVHFRLVYFQFAKYTYICKCSVFLLVNIWVRTLMTFPGVTLRRFNYTTEAKFVMQTQKPQITYHSSTTLLILDHLTFSGELFPFLLSYF